MCSVLSSVSFFMAVRPINRKLNRSSPLKIGIFAIQLSKNPQLWFYFIFISMSIVRCAEDLMKEVIQHFAILPHARLPRVFLF